MNVVPNNIDDIVQADKAHVWHHLTQHKPFETSDPRVMIEGKGCRVWDAHGKEHLDAVSGGVWTVNVGYGRERIAKAIYDQVMKIPFFGNVLFSHNLTVYGSFLVVAVVWVFFYRTRPGLNLQGVGERPEAAYARGIAVNKLRYVYTILGGALVGLAGAAYSLDVKLGWRETLTLNLGWIALAIVIFGGWHPIRVAVGCYLRGSAPKPGVRVMAPRGSFTWPACCQVRR